MTLNPDSLAAKDIHYTIHPFTNLALHEEKGPLIMTRGEGVYVWDEQGKRYLEGIAGLWCTGLGFSESRLVEAAHRQLQTLPYSHVFAHRSTPPVIELAERLVKQAPEGLSRAFFMGSGSEANDTAIKFVWYYNNAVGRPEKKKIIARRRGYHGVTVASGSLTGLPMVHGAFDLPIDRILHTDSPCPYRDRHPGESEADFVARLAANLEALIQQEGPDTIAAFIAEPVMGAGGVVIPPEGYFQAIQPILKKYDILLIADEVICGFGRTGNFWGTETYGLQPDILTCAKQLTSAYIPLSAILISEPIYQAMREMSARQGALGMGYTYGGHPVAAAVALEVLNIYAERDLVGRVRELAPQFQAHLTSLSEHPLVGNARSVGLIGALEIVADKSTREQFPTERKVAASIAAHAQQRGLVVRPLGGDIIAICPPLIISEAELNELFSTLHEALQATWQDHQAAA